MFAAKFIFVGGSKITGVNKFMEGKEVKYPEPRIQTLGGVRSGFINDIFTAAAQEGKDQAFFTKELMEGRINSNVKTYVGKFSADGKRSPCVGMDQKDNEKADKCDDNQKRMATAMQDDAANWVGDEGNLNKANQDLGVINAELENISSWTDQVQRNLNTHKQEAQNTISNQWANAYEPLLEELRAKKNELVGLLATTDEQARNKYTGTKAAIDTRIAAIKKVRQNIVKALEKAVEGNETAATEKLTALNDAGLEFIAKSSGHIGNLLKNINAEVNSTMQENPKRMMALDAAANTKPAQEKVNEAKKAITAAAQGAGAVVNMKRRVQKFMSDSENELTSVAIFSYDSLQEKVKSWKAKVLRKYQKQLILVGQDIQKDAKQFRKKYTAMKKLGESMLKAERKKWKRILKKEKKALRKAVLRFRKRPQLLLKIAKNLDREVKSRASRFETRVMKAKAAILKVGARERIWNQEMASRWKEMRTNVLDHATRIAKAKESEAKKIIETFVDNIEIMFEEMEKTLETTERQLTTREKSEKKVVKSQNSYIRRMERDFKKQWKKVAKATKKSKKILAKSEKAVSARAQISAPLVAQAKTHVNRLVRTSKKNILDEEAQLVEHLNALAAKMEKVYQGPEKALSEQGYKIEGDFSTKVKREVAALEGREQAMKESVEADNYEAESKPLIAQISTEKTRIRRLAKESAELAAEVKENEKETVKGLRNIETKSTLEAVSESGEEEQNLEELLENAKRRQAVALESARKKAAAQVSELEQALEATTESWKQMFADQEKEAIQNGKDLDKLKRKINRPDEREAALRSKFEAAKTRNKEQTAKELALIDGIVAKAQQKLAAAIKSALKKTDKEEDIIIHAEQSKWSRKAATLPKEIGKLDQLLVDKTEEQKETLGTVVEHSDLLRAYAGQLAAGEQNSVGQFLEGIQTLTSSTAQLLEGVEAGSKEEARIFEAQSRELEKLVSQALPKVAERTREKLQAEVKAMQAKMQTIAADNSLSAEERRAAIQRLQRDTEQALLAIISEDEQLAAQGRIYIKDAELARQREALATEEEALAGARMGEERAAYEAQTQADAKARATGNLKRLAAAIKEEEAARTEEAAKLREMKAEDAQDAQLIQSATGAMTAGVGRKLAHAEELAARSSAEASAESRETRAILGREQSLLSQMGGSVAENAKTLGLAVERERQREALGLLGEQEARKHVTRELFGVLDEAKNLARTIAVKRMTKAADLAKDFDHMLKTTERADPELHAALVKKVDLGKKVLKELVDMKIEMFKELELEGYAGESSALTQQKFMALRRMLQDSETKRGKLNAALDAALRAKLADLGIDDSKTSEQLKAFLGKMNMLATKGDEEGVRRLLQQLRDDFGIEIAAGDGLHSLLGSTMGALNHKQAAARKLLKGVEKGYADLNVDFETARKDMNRFLSKENQLATLSDEELARRTKDLNRLVAKVRATQSLLEMGLAERAAAGAKRRAAAVAEHRRLSSILRAALSTRKGALAVSNLRR